MNSGIFIRTNTYVHLHKLRQKRKDNEEKTLVSHKLSYTMKRLLEFILYKLQITFKKKLANVVRLESSLSEAILTSSGLFWRASVK